MRSEGKSGTAIKNELGYNAYFTRIRGALCKKGVFHS